MQIDARSVHRQNALLRMTESPEFGSNAKILRRKPDVKAPYPICRTDVGIKMKLNRSQLAQKRIGRCDAASNARVARDGFRKHSSQFETRMKEHKILRVKMPLLRLPRLTSRIQSPRPEIRHIRRSSRQEYMYIAQQQERRMMSSCNTIQRQLREKGHSTSKST
jgi:hypothetical protein